MDMLTQIAWSALPALLSGIVLAIFGRQQNKRDKAADKREEERKKSGNHYMTTKKEKHRHGFGLNIIRKIARRYDGEVIIDDGNHQFVVTVLLYEIFSM